MLCCCCAIVLVNRLRDARRKLEREQQELDTTVVVRRPLARMPSDCPARYLSLLTGMARTGQPRTFWEQLATRDQAGEDNYSAPRRELREPRRVGGWQQNTTCVESV